MNCEGEVCHLSSTRIRVRFPTVKGRRAEMARLCAALQGLEPVASVSANHRTGSVVIGHRQRGEDILAAIEFDAPFPISLSFRPRPQALSKVFKTKVRKSLKKANKKVGYLSDGELDMPMLFGISLAGMALYQARSGFFLPAGLTMMLLAFRTLDEEKN